jgi:RecB family exonuclease
VFEILDFIEITAPVDHSVSQAAATPEVGGAAQTFTERLPQASPRQFVHYLESQDFAADTLGARAQASDVVTFTTPTAASGREWDVVAIAGVEEGVWPNLRLRDSVLGASHLADILLGRAEASPLTPAGRVEAAQAARRGVLDDETRAFAVAVSRARSRLIVTALQADESQPSRYMAWVEAASGVKRVRESAVTGVSDLRAAVAQLRVDGTGAEVAGQDRFATMLAHLVRHRAAGADPSQWHGVPEPSTLAPLWDKDAAVRVSPSKVDVIETCALKWALESAGGTPESSDKQQLGTLVHEIAAQHPQGSEAELMRALDERWHEIAGLDSWPDRVQRAHAEEIMQRLAHYLNERRDVAVAVEQAFSVQVGRAVLAGSADRVEVTDSLATIVDLKTGKPIPTADVPHHGQLAMYQLAAHEGGFAQASGVSGAQLVFLGSGVKPPVRVQHQIDVDEQRQRLADVVEVMAGTDFVATPNDMCERCPVRRSCPAQATGRQVSDT